MLLLEIFRHCAAFAVGAVVGSFLGVLVTRLPAMAREDPPQLTLCAPRSHCPHCRRTLRVLHLIPIFSYLALRGRCAFCGVHIPSQYLLLEMLAGLLAVGVVAGMDSLLEAGAYAVLGWGLLALAVIDWQTQLLPDLIVYPLLWLGLLANAYGLFVPPHEAIIGAMVGYLSLWALNHLFYLVRKEAGMGYGDFKMFAVCGAWLGWTMLPWAALGAAILTLLMWLSLRGWENRTRRMVPFGPALAVSLLVLMTWQDSARAWMEAAGLWRAGA